MTTIKHWMVCCLALLGLVTLNACSDDDDNLPSSGLLIFADDNRVVTLDNESMEGSIAFTSRVVWTAEAEENNWLSVTPAEGKGGPAKIGFYAKSSNNGDEPRSVTVNIKAGGQTEQIIVTQLTSGLKVMEESDVKDFDKYYKPQEFSSINMLRSDAKWSWWRSKQSDHFFVFWEAGFGDDPNAESVPAALRVDIDDLLAKAEQFYNTNINRLGMAVTGQGKSQLDNYKMEIYLLYQTEWLATGSGYDNTIGALWVNPSTCQPVGSTIAHEIGHSFQYQVYCDKIAFDGAADDSHHGFRYGYPNSNGGCGYWEQCAQWQAHQDYPVEQFQSYNFDVWVQNCHRHFEHEWQRYASYWLQTYWVAKHGVEAYGRIWRESAYPDDAIETYTKIYNGGDYAKTREELADYALRMATYDIDGMREYNDADYQSRYSTKMLKNAAGAFQPVYAQCPGATGFNVLPLNVPAEGTTVSVSFEGLNLGAALLDEDPGEQKDGDGKVVGTTRNYNSVGSQSNMGWRYGFVALSTSGQRTYSTIGKDKNGELSFTVPAGTKQLFFVVQGSPESYVQNPWDEKEETDAQYPYAVKFSGTGLQGYVDVDENADPKDVNINVTVDGSAASGDYVQGTLQLATQELCQAFAMSSDKLSAALLAVGEAPAEGKIAIQNTQADGSLITAGTANNGFWLDANGDVCGWGETAMTYYELAGSTLTWGHYPGHTTAGQSYKLRPTLIYTKGGKQYKAVITITANF